MSSIKSNLFSVAIILLFVLSGCDLFTDMNDEEPEEHEPRAAYNYQWSEPEYVSTGLPNRVIYPDMVIHRERKKFAWGHTVEDGLDPEDIYNRVYDGSWEEPENISNSIYESSHTVLERAPDGTLHLVWAENRTDEQDEDQPPRPTGPGSDADVILYSNNAGGSWQEPELLYDAGTNDFFFPPSSIGFDENDNPHVVFTAFDAANEYAMFYMNKTGGAWSEVKKIQNRASLADLTMSRNGTMAITYISAYTDEEEEEAYGNSVFIRTSEDLGETWSDPVLVDKSDDGHNQHPIITSSPDGKLHLIWFKAMENRGSSSIVDYAYHSYSEDGGASWSDPVNVTPEVETHLHIFDQPSVTINDEGHVLLAFVMGAFSGSDFPLYIAEWSPGEGWTEEENLFDARSVNQQIAVDSDDSGFHILFFSGDFDENGLFYSNSIR